MQYVDPNLPRDIFGWHSPRLGIDMPLARYGDKGHPLILFPTAQADFLENERFFLIKAIEPHIFAGKCQVFCVDSINRHAWMNRHVSVPEAARRQALFARYIEEEVVPHVRRVVGDPDVRVATSGASFGAFHAANQFFRRPDLFDTLIAMSGFYDLTDDYTGSFVNDDVYFNNPISYVANLGGEYLQRLRTDTRICIISGQGAYESPRSSVQLSALLRAKEIPHELDLWGYDVNHDWPWWRRMLDHYIGSRLGW